MSILRQTLCAVVVSYACVSTSLVMSWTSSTQKLFSSVNTTLERPMTASEIAFLGSLPSFGGLVGTPICGFLLDSIGRKYSCILFSLPQVILWVVVVLSNHVEVILWARFFSGFGFCKLLIVSVYISEFCHKSIRGMLSCGGTIGYGVGMLSSFLIGGYFDYETMNYVFLSMTVLGVLILLPLKESPIFLMKKGREKEAAKSIAFYRACSENSTEVTQEIMTIRRALHPDLDGVRTTSARSAIIAYRCLKFLMSILSSDVFCSYLFLTGVATEEEKLNPELKEEEKISKWRLLRKSSSTHRALFVVMTLYLGSALQGPLPVQVYAEQLFSEAIPNMSSTLTSALFATVATVSTFVASHLMDTTGRRTLMVNASIGAGVCCVLLGSQIHFHWGPYWITAIFLYIFVATFGCGAGSVPFVVAAEVFIPEIRGILTMICMEWAWICNFCILFIFTYLLAWFGLGTVFYLFAIVGFCNAAFCFFFLPETKEVPIDVIQSLFIKKRTRHDAF